MGRRVFISVVFALSVFDSIGIILLCQGWSDGIFINSNFTLLQHVVFIPPYSVALSHPATVAALLNRIFISFGVVVTRAF